MPKDNNLVRPEPRGAFLDRVEQFAGRNFQYRHEIEYLFQRSDQSGETNILDELLFTAKFVSNAHSVLQRLGPGSNGTENLAQEYSKNLKRSVDLLRMLLPQNPDVVSEKIRRELLGQSGEELEQLLNFLYEVSWIKNYLLDTTRQDS
jgi:hypothetical protein